MSVRRVLATLVLAGAAFAPAAHADYPYTCDDVDCFAVWCVDHLGDCRDASPSWGFCYSNPSLCVAGSNDITYYAVYCTLVQSPVWCVL